MITGKAIYDVLSAMVPLYVSMILAYGSVRWWKVITVEQCAGINRYVSLFAVPFLCFHVISTNDIYAMNLPFIAADCLQKVVLLVVLFAWQAISKRGTVDWTITIFSLSTLPNTLIVGVPLLVSMYGEFSGPLMVQIVVMQSAVWYTLLLVLLEYRAAKELFSKQLRPETTRAVASFRVDSDVHSLKSSGPLQIETEVREDNKIELVVRRSASCPRSSMNMRVPSNLTDVEVYSMRSGSSRVARTRNSDGAYNDVYEVPTAAINGAMPQMRKVGSMNSEHMTFDGGVNKGGGSKDTSSSHRQSKEQGEGHTIVLLKSPTIGAITVDPLADVQPKTTSMAIGDGEKNGDADREAMPGTLVMIRLMVTMVLRKLLRNLNTYASVGGLVWSLIAFRWHFRMPKIIEGSIEILSNTGMGMSTFSLGLFMATQPKLISCGMKAAVLSMAARFLVSPAVAAATAAAVGLRGDLLRVAVVQAALPQAIVTFVFAKEYDCHPDLLCTSVGFGVIISLPVTIIYYLLIGL